METIGKIRTTPKHERTITWGPPLEVQTLEMFRVVARFGL